MNTGRIYRNTAILALLRILEPVVSFAVVMAISRCLGPAVFGTYAVIIAAVSTGVLVGQLGLTTLLVREVARKPELTRAHLRIALAIAAASSVLLTLAFTGMPAVLRIPAESRAVAVLASVGILPAILVGCYESVFTGFERMELVLFRSLAAGVVRAAMMVGTVLAGGGLLQLVVVDLVTAVVSVVLCLGAFQRLPVPPQRPMERAEKKALLQAVLPFYGMSLVTTLTARMDLFMLSRYRTPAEVALYVAALKFFEVAMVAPVCYIRAAFPQLSGLVHRAPEQLVGFIGKLLHDAWWYATGMAVGLIGFGGVALYVVFGSHFAGAQVALEVLALAVIPSCLARIYSISLLARDLQKYELLVGSAATLVNVALQWWLVPRFGVAGSAVATLASLTSGAILFTLCVRLKLGASSRAGLSAWFLLSLAGCAGLMSATRPSGPVRIIVASAVLLFLSGLLFRKFSQWRQMIKIG
jgi:O-antigen/teichoic acid export membrane protein